MTAKTISWSKWYNPWDNDYTNYEEDDEEQEDKPYKDSFEEHAHKKQTGQKVLVSPMGAVTLMTPRAIEELMNFWIGQTNFKLNNPICRIIGETDGVESFEVISPYRMRVAVATLYQPGQTMNLISQNVNDYFGELKIIDTKPPKRFIGQILADKSLLEKAPWLVECRSE
jgi:hypothetical protein